MAEEKTRLNIELDDDDLKLFNELKEKSRSKSNKATFLFCMKVTKFVLGSDLKREKNGKIVDIEILT